MPLTVKSIEALKPKKNLYRVADGHGLCLEVTPTGSKLWRFRYRIDGKGKMLALGRWPDVNLQDARSACQTMRQQLANGLDPVAVLQERKSEGEGKDTFESFARLWFSKFRHKWVDRTATRKLRQLEVHVFPLIGSLPVDRTDAPQIRRVLLRLESMDKLSTAHRVKNTIGEIMRYAVAMGLIVHNPVPDLAGALPPTQEKHRASIVDPKGIGELLRAIDGYSGSLVTKCALKLAALTFVRPGELRHAEWSEIDLEGEEWRIPAGKMKMRRPHVVPLSCQALAILREIQPVTGHGKYVFPSERSSARAMSNNTILAALRRMGYAKEEMSGHGFRSMASTNLNEMGFHPDHIERQLAHVEANRVRAAYNYAEHLPERKKMMQAWADYLDGLREGGKVIPIHANTR